ncbi:MAG: hypothetical protein ABIG61_12245 [Planctomycetota bacterium]
MAERTEKIRECDARNRQGMVCRKRTGTEKYKLQIAVVTNPTDPDDAPIHEVLVDIQGELCNRHFVSLIKKIKMSFGQE